MQEGGDSRMADIVASPSQHLGSSCASTGLPEPHMPGLPVEEQLFLVDAITQRTTCELHTLIGNLSIKVVYVSALPILPNHTCHGMEIPPSYASAGVERIPGSQFEGLELDFLAGDGSTTLGEVVHRVILWRKRYIIIPSVEAPPQSSRPLSANPQQRPSPQTSRPSCPPQPAPQSRSPSPPHPGGWSDDDDNNTPPRSPSPGLRAPFKKSRLPPPKPRQRKKKTKEPEVTPEERWEAMTHEERWIEIQVQASEWLREQRELRKAREMEPSPCLRQEPGNDNLCGYYVCEHMHNLLGPKIIKNTEHEFKMWNIQLGLLKKERVAAICEGLIGFLVDEVVNPQGDFHYDG
uniref:DUF8039 domain-containing protein n=1 Tax=Setaria viridis TaxID=4556 RepID=A0A4U6VCG9_SETVI|nr:hypothetical protein SEVIR_3G183800v2 [Setaria viridis]